jgi:hypothetical protein
MRKKITGKLILIQVLLACALSVQSQPPPPPPGPGCWPPPCSVPINSGIVLLMIAGFLYGTFVLYKIQKKKAL